MDLVQLIVVAQYAPYAALIYLIVQNHYLQSRLKRIEKRNERIEREIERLKRVSVYICAKISTNDICEKLLE